MHATSTGGRRRRRRLRAARRRFRDRRPRRPARPRLRRADAGRPRLRRARPSRSRRSRVAGSPRGAHSACGARDRGLPWDAERVGLATLVTVVRRLRRALVRRLDVVRPRQRGRSRCCAPAGSPGAGRCAAASRAEGPTGVVGAAERAGLIVPRRTWTMRRAPGPLAACAVPHRLVGARVGSWRWPSCGPSSSPCARSTRATPRSRACRCGADAAAADIALIAHPAQPALRRALVGARRRARGRRATDGAAGRARARRRACSPPTPRPGGGSAASAWRARRPPAGR